MGVLSIVAHYGQVTLHNVTELDCRWLRQWLVAYSVPWHHLSNAELLTIVQNGYKQILMKIE